MIYIDDNIHGFDLATALTEISEQRRLQALAFKYESGQRLCVLAYQLLKQGLREEYGITDNPVFEYNEHGKPSIIGHPEIHFNLSHCKYAAVCVLSDRPVGIDVESIRACRESLVAYTMSDAEVQLIQSAPRPEVEFIRLWTMKEAALKLMGTGISNELRTVLSDNSQLHFTTHVTPQYIYTVCEYPRE